MPPGNKRSKHSHAIQTSVQELRMIDSPLEFDLTDSSDSSSSSDDDSTILMNSDAHWEDEIDISYIELLWTEDADNHLPGRAPYTGASSRTARRNAAKEFTYRQTSAFTGTPAITTFYQPFIGPSLPPSNGLPLTISPLISSPATNNYDTVVTISTDMTPAQGLCYLKDNNLASLSSNRKYDINSNHDHYRYVAIDRYLKSLLEGAGKMKASLDASAWFRGTPGDYLSRTIRNWAAYFLANRVLPKKMQGCYIKSDARNNPPSVSTCWTIHAGLSKELSFTGPG